MRRVVLSAGVFALAAAFSLAPSARETKTATDTQIVCKDGTTSEAKHLRGACSGHGGVDKTVTNTATATSDKNASTSASASTESKSSKNTRVLGAGAAKVWANDSTKVYHCAGDRYYGKTKHGEYMSENEAKDQGFRPDHGKTCAERAK